MNDPNGVSQIDSVAEMGVALVRLLRVITACLADQPAVDKDLLLAGLRRAVEIPGEDPAARLCRFVLKDLVEDVESRHRQPPPGR